MLLSNSIVYYICIGISCSTTTSIRRIRMNTTMTTFNIIIFDEKFNTKITFTYLICLFCKIPGHRIHKDMVFPLCESFDGDEGDSFVKMNDHKHRNEMVCLLNQNNSMLYYITCLKQKQLTCMSSHVI